MFSMKSEIHMHIVSSKGSPFVCSGRGISFALRLGYHIDVFQFPTNIKNYMLAYPLQISTSFFSREKTV